MARIMLRSDFPYKDVSVPTMFIDKYMPEANGEFVKVYLFLLRSLSAGSDCSISTIADTFDHTEKDVIRALKYWERQNLLTLEFNTDNTLAGICINNIYQIDDDYSSESASVTRSASAFNSTSMRTVSATSTSEYVSASDSASINSQEIISRPSVNSYVQSAVSNITPISHNAKREYTLDEVKTFRQNPDISELFFIVEAYLKHTLSSSDINTILYWHEELDFSTDLIEYLVEYCISKGHSSTRYMDKVALSWAETGITTVEQAKESAAVHSQIYYSVMKALGISGRNLVESEMNFIKKWSKEFGFDTELINLACQRTISTIHQPSFEYVDSIMTSWHNNQVKTVSDVDRLDAAFNKTKKITIDTTDKVIAPKRNRFTDINSRNYDYDQLERVLLTTSVQ